jgi:hypothetical protein
LLTRSQVALENHAAPPLGLYRAPRLGRIAALCRKRRDGHVRAFAGIQDGDGPADARIPSRDERGFSLQLTGGPVPLRLITRPRFELGFDARLVELLLGKWRLRFGGDLWL